MKKNKKTALQVHDEREAQRKESVRANSMDNMCSDGTTTKSNVSSLPAENANKLTSNGEKSVVSLSQSERAIISCIENLIAGNTVNIVKTLFLTEIGAEFSRQISILTNNGQKRNAGILRVMLEQFLSIENGATFIEFKSNVSLLRQKAIQEYRETFEAEKIAAEKRTAIENNIKALENVRAFIGEEAFNNGVNALKTQLANI